MKSMVIRNEDLTRRASVRAQAILRAAYHQGDQTQTMITLFVFGPGARTRVATRVVEATANR